jgi:hypothetical protein
MKNWTSAAENLPPDGERVLVATADHDSGEVIHIATCSDEQWISTDGETGFDVLFWMPLPDEPEID